MDLDWEAKLTPAFLKKTTKGKGGRASNMQTTAAYSFGYLGPVRLALNDLASRAQEVVVFLNFTFGRRIRAGQSKGWMGENTSNQPPVNTSAFKLLRRRDIWIAFHDLNFQGGGGRGDG